MMRQFLLTKFVCATCGTPLEVTRNIPTDAGGYVEGEPTGAAKVEQLVAVVPCRSCAEPAEKLANAVATLLDAARKGDPRVR